MEEIIEDFYTDEKIEMLYILEEERKLQEFLKEQKEPVWEHI